MNDDVSGSAGAHGAGAAGRPSDPGYEPIGQVIARSLRDQILGGSLRPGMPIRQAAVAESFGTSRMPVRDALQQLENEGLVTWVPHSGARVAKMDHREHLELYRVREALEPIAISESAGRLSEATIARLRELTSEIELAADDLQTYLKLDREFHLMTYSAAPLPLILQMIADFWTRTQQYRRAFLQTVEASRHAVDLGFLEHRLIVDAVAIGDGDAAAELVKLHLRRTRLRLAEHVELFDGVPGR